jgi:hypothetical protein
LTERTFAHLYETGAMRRVHLRGRENILKRVLIHGAAFNLSLILRKLLGAGTPRELRAFCTQLFAAIERQWQLFLGAEHAFQPKYLLCIAAWSVVIFESESTTTTGC